MWDLQLAYDIKILGVKRCTEAEGSELESVFLCPDCSFITIEEFYSPVLLVALVEVWSPEHCPGNAGLLLCLWSAVFHLSGNEHRKCETAHTSRCWLILVTQTEDWGRQEFRNSNSGSPEVTGRSFLFHPSFYHIIEDKIMPSNAFTKGTGVKIPHHRLSAGCQFEAVSKNP